jgi:EmrB/QacA subfamily drug resistance transporter
MDTTTAATSTAAPAPPNRLLALLVLCAGTLMIILDGTVVTVAMPAIQEDLGFTSSGLAWVVNAYLIAFGGLLLLAGRLGDLLGRKQVFLAGLALFTAASLACGLAQSQAHLVVARFVQGVGGALTAAVILGMIVTLFPEPGERGRAIGTYSFVQAAGGGIGLLVGGLLTQAISWHWIFVVNVPVGLVALVVARRVVPGDEGIGLRAGADVPGALLVTSGLMVGVAALVGTADHGWSGGRTLSLGAASLALLAAFVVRQAHAVRPLLPLGILRSREVVGANAAQVLMVAGLFGFQFLIALFLQQVLGYTAAESGLAMLPVTVAIAVFSLGLSGRLNQRFGAGRVLRPGLVLLVVGLLLLARLPVDASYVIDVLPAMLVLGTGGGLSLPAVMTLGMSGATPEDSGLVSGLLNTTQQVGGALGLSILASLAAGRTATELGGGTQEATALAAGYHLAWLVAAGFVTFALVVAVVVLPRRAAAPHGEVAAAVPDGA